MEVMINRCASFAEKSGIYAFYVNFNFIFLKGSAAKLMRTLLASANPDGFLDANVVPESFARYLVSKDILVGEIP